MKLVRWVVRVSEVGMLEQYVPGKKKKKKRKALARTWERKTSICKEQRNSVLEVQGKPYNDLR